jgi:AhpD family alkylhydroperoxidase
MQSRIPNPALSVPGLLDALQSLSKAANDAASQAGLPHTTLELVNLRASQINGCAVCLDMHTRGAKKAGETDERLFTLAAWRDTPYFTDAERAALALTEAGTRLADHSEPVPDALFDEAAKHYDGGGAWLRWSCVLRPSTRGTASMSLPGSKPANGRRNWSTERRLLTPTGPKIPQGVS